MAARIVCLKIFSTQSVCLINLMALLFLPSPAGKTLL